MELNNGNAVDNNSNETQNRDSLTASLSDPNPRNRRARWIKHRIRKTNDGLRSGFLKSDSGFHDNSEGSQKYRNSHELERKPNGVGLDETWIPPAMGKKRTHHRPVISLPPQNGKVFKGDSNDSTSYDITEESPYHRRTSSQSNGNYPSLSRRNGFRCTMKGRPQSPGSPVSISSESEASHGECEGAMADPDAMLLQTLPKERKQSVLVASYEAWNDESIAQCFRDLSPAVSGILDTAWNGQLNQLEELLAEEENLEKIKSDSLRDCYGRTPLHLAAAGGHIDVVKLLLSKGGTVDAYDVENNTPLSCAASCGSLPVLELLLAHGANVNAGYEYGKTALHWAVQAGSVDCARKLLESGAKQNPPLVYCETPAHIAASLGDFATLQLLINYGADVSLCKGTNKSTCLHLAAEEGSAACVRVLLRAGASHHVKDGRGHTPLHVAASNDADCVSLLLAAGADPNATDNNGRTVLHCSVSRGSRAAECVRQLVEGGADIDAQDSFGYSSLHLCAVNESSQCASILLQHGADVTIKTKAGTTALSLLVRRIPDVMRYLVDRLDEAVTIHDHDVGDPDCEIRLDFRAVVPNSERKLTSSKSSKLPERTYYHNPRRETDFLTCLLAAGNKKILSHPLSEAFLTLKWQRVRKFFWASLLFQIALVTLFTIFVIEVFLMRCPYRRLKASQTEISSTPDFRTPLPLLNWTDLRNYNGSRSSNKRVRRSSGSFSWFSFSPGKHQNETEGSSNNKNSDSKIRTGINSFTTTNIGSIPTPDNSANNNDNHSDVHITPLIGQKCEMGTHLTVIWALLISFAILMAVKEIFQLLQSPFSYLVSSENWGQWALIGSVALTAWRTPEFQLSYWQYPTAACGIFLAWGLMLLQVGRFPALGMYVQMLGKVAANFGLFILAYACLLIAFALAFCVLFPEYPAYSSVPLALLKVLTMMVGEVDYEDLFYNEEHADDPMIYPITAHVLHASFVIIVTIVLMNLLVGLAVHDIQGLQKGAKLNRLSRQTALICRLESFIFSKSLQTCLPRSFGAILQKSALLVPSSYNWSYYFRPNDPRDKRLPKELKKAALRLAAQKHVSNKHTTVSANKSHSSDLKTRLSVTHSGSSRDHGIQRIEQRLDALQSQLENFMKSFSDRLDNLNTTIHEASIEKDDEM